MKLNRKIIVAFAALTAALTAKSQSDTVFVYSPDERSGLRIAAHSNGGKWKELGQLCSSDYGTWGAEKRMYAPCLCRADDGTWRLVFQVNSHSPVFAAAYSRDLINWRPQDYPIMSTHKCLKPMVRPTEKGFEVVFNSEKGIRLTEATYDFRHFTTDVPTNSTFNANFSEESVDGKKRHGQLFAVSTDEMAHIRRHFKQRKADEKLSAERMHDDAKKLAHLPETVEATLTVETAREKTISDMLIGVFFEDISYAADGGLYAELVQNRDFEYTAHDHKGWKATTAWHSDATINIATDNPLSQQNPHHAIVTKKPLWNSGWDGIVVEEGKKYDFSIFIRGEKDITVQLLAADGKAIAQGQVKATGNEWRKYECVLTVNAPASTRQANGQTAKRPNDQTTKQPNDGTYTGCRLMLIPKGKQAAAIDMVSLFPQDTFKGRKNGFRRDLAQAIADLHPKFVRFPGGCMSHGQGIDNIYHWHHTIGPLEERTPDMNIWHYHQTRGLGFYEYFQFCEDIGAEPLPVLAAGVPCQNSENDKNGLGGQQGGISWQDMPAYIDELCHLIEWANADPNTNEWAAKRAEAGHPAPFNMKYIGIGNEDIISTVFEERYEMICQALRTRHPEIKICGTVGPFHSPSADYIEGWDFTKKHPELQYITDEHYYESTGWFINHRDYYDKYERTPSTDGNAATKVYLGEWAASTKEKRPNVETALAEAIYLTDIERNADIVEMTSYAPMLCKDGHSNWNPNMIYFSNTHIRTTPAYEIQRLFSLYGGDRYIHTQLATTDTKTAHRIAASLVRDSKTNRRYLKLVNALPTTLNITVEGLQTPPRAKCIQFTGSITDQKAKAVEIETASPTTLPPYSLRVIEL